MLLDLMSMRKLVQVRDHATAARMHTLHRSIWVENVIRLFVTFLLYHYSRLPFSFGLQELEDWLRHFREPFAEGIMVLFFILSFAQNWTVSWTVLEWNVSFVYIFLCSSGGTQPVRLKLNLVILQLFLRLRLLFEVNLEIYLVEIDELCVYVLTTLGRVIKRLDPLLYNDLNNVSNALGHLDVLDCG